MMRSLFAGVSGLKNHQTRMDVIGNNIANVNTVGFKKSRVTFQDMLSQTLRGSASPTAVRGGTNPMQVGLGMTLASIDTIMTAGSPQSTGKNTDLSVEGEGFFILSDGSGTYYTRAGNFDFDYNKNFVNSSNGMLVQGILADANGVIDPKGAIADINLASQLSSPPKATTAVSYTKNLDSNATAGAAYTVPMTVYDSKGKTHQLDVTFTKAAAPAVNTWNVDVKIDGLEPNGGTGGLGTLGHSVVAFDATGKYNAAGSTIQAVHQTVAGGADLDITPDYSVMTQYAGEYTVIAYTQNGYEPGDLQSISVDTSGILSGTFSNGQSRQLAQLATATFSNPGGLMKSGNNLFVESNNSGRADTGVPGVSGRGIIKPESLEMSNVDLSQEFVDMIITQRGFQANSRVITTSDQILEELVNLRR